MERRAHAQRGKRVGGIFFREGREGGGMHKVPDFTTEPRVFNKFYFWYGEEVSVLEDTGIAWNKCVPQHI